MLTFVIYSIAVLISYGFVKNLHFFGEDFGDIQILLFGAENQPFPYQGIKYLLYPLFLIFGNQPSGYFQVALLLYTLLSLFLAFTIWKLTHNKLIAFTSGLLFAAGYVGSESMFVIELAIPEIMFIFSMLAVLFFYNRYLSLRDVGSWVLAFFIYTLSLIFISQRAHTLAVIVFLADLCLMWNQRTAPLYKNITDTLKRVSSFIIVFIAVYVGLPLLLHGSIGGYVGTFWVWGTYDVLNKNSYLIFLSDLGNYLVPSVFQEQIAGFLQKLNYDLAAPLTVGVFLLLPTLLLFRSKRLLTQNKKYVHTYWIFLLANSYLLAGFSERRLNLLLGSTIGLLTLSLISAVYLFVKSNKNARKLLIFFSLSWLASNFLYHIHEANLVHSSAHRYFTSGFPFFVSIIALVVVEVFNKRSYGKLLKTVGYVFVVLIFSSYLFASYLSPVRQGFLNRSLYLHNFSASLKSFVPRLDHERKLFYFDVTHDAEIESLFNSFLFTGSFSDETALATLYGESQDNIKIVKDYESFIQEKKNGGYDNTYAFFYDTEKKLHFLDSISGLVMSHRSITIDDFSKLKLGLYYSSRINVPLLKGKTIYYKSHEGYFSEEFQNINEILELGVENLNFPSCKPMRLDVVMTLNRINSGFDNFKNEGPGKMNGGKDQNLSVVAYAINDKFLFRSQSPASKTRVGLDGKKHTYSFFLPPGGSKLKSLLIEFPNVPISVTIVKVFLPRWIRFFFT